MSVLLFNYEKFLTHFNFFSSDRKRRHIYEKNVSPSKKAVHETRTTARKNDSNY